MPKISVIMGVYNCKDIKGLEQSIESIIQQTFRDWEFIICNDGSTDDTFKYLIKFSTKDSRIKIISYKNNHGLAFALNYCLKYAKGEYIARQDDDDVSKADRLEKELMFLDSHPEYAFVGTLADVFDEGGMWGKYNLREKPDKKAFFWNSPFLHPSILIRKNVLNLVSGYRVINETRRCEDYDLFMRLYALNIKGYNLQEYLYKYRFDRQTNKKYRNLSDRINEAKIRWCGFKKMGVLWLGIPFIVKPILIGIIPQKIYDFIKLTNSSFRKV